jgi:signal transduction histidine kinase
MWGLMASDVTGPEVSRHSNLFQNEEHSIAGDAPEFRVVVEGTRRPLAPLLNSDVYQIGRELLRNAFQRANARRIEVEIRYSDDVLQLRVRDDGKGIEPTVLKEGGRRGHWGLTGMRERAKNIGGQFTIWSKSGAGTEAELRIPSRAAYAHRLSHGVF